MTFLDSLTEDQFALFYLAVFYAACLLYGWLTKED